ncbi:MAG: hypothetical protein DI526_00285 [Caulobacter segnis]|uniref:Uncharacterized protein n=1 Tax=Caulobacter segnis TaxID=88688 RepID=A0A2W5XHD7_9CAUL|nr:MAG: hypothetical protein DI526_00285 [Caulobacter segnis]
MEATGRPPVAWRLLAVRPRAAIQAFHLPPNPSAPGALPWIKDDRGRAGQKKARRNRRASSLGRKRPGRAEAAAPPHGIVYRVRRKIRQAEK